MITIESSGSFKNMQKRLGYLSKVNIQAVLDKYGAQGVAALSAATPRESGETAASWTYEIDKKGRSWVIKWFNSHREGGAPIAVLIQYGHATRNGGYVQGRDYINPVMRPIFDQIAADVWKEVSR